MQTDNIRVHYGSGQTKIWMQHRSCIGAAFSSLRRYTEKKLFGGSNVSAQQLQKIFPYRRDTPPSKDMEIRCHFFPTGSTRIRYHTQINPLNQNAMGTPQTTDHNFQPVCHKPGGYPAVRINVLCRSEKTLHAGLPVEKPIKQRADHGRCRVLHIRDEMVRKKGKGCFLFATQKSGDWNPLFPENRENVDDIAFVRGNRPVTVEFAADRTHRPDHRREINLTPGKCFFIFPDTLECGNKRQLYRITALSSRRQVFGSEILWPASLRRVVSFSRSISYLDNLPSLISPVTLLCKNFSSQFG
jgi:hypothetical protein